MDDLPHQNLYYYLTPLLERTTPSNTLYTGLTFSHRLGHTTTPCNTTLGRRGATLVHNVSHFSFVLDGWTYGTNTGGTTNPGRGEHNTYF